MSGSIDLTILLIKVLISGQGKSPYNIIRRKIDTTLFSRHLHNGQVLIRSKCSMDSYPVCTMQRVISKVPPTSHVTWQTVISPRTTCPEGVREGSTNSTMADSEELG